jgi:acetyl esterase/lipase
MQLRSFGEVLLRRLPAPFARDTIERQWRWIRKRRNKANFEAIFLFHGGFGGVFAFELRT